MVSERTRTIVGYSLLGFGLSILIFSLFYVITTRAGIAQRFVWSWVAIHLAVLLTPPLLFGFYGATRKPPVTQ